MSKGPGRLERLITETFTNNPSETYTIKQLSILAYPGVNRIEKKHTVAVARAARKVAYDMWWDTGAVWNEAGGPIVYYNRCNLKSYAIGNFGYRGWGRGDLSEWYDAIGSEEGDSRYADDIRPGGFMHDRVSRCIAARDGVEPDPEIVARAEAHSKSNEIMAATLKAALGK